MLVLTGFYWYDAEQKKNESVIKRVRNELITLMGSKEVGSDLKAVPLLMLERHEKGSMKNYLSGLNTKARFGLALDAYQVFIGYNKYDSNTIRNEIISTTEADLKDLLSKKTDYPF